MLSGSQASAQENEGLFEPVTGATATSLDEPWVIDQRFAEIKFELLSATSEGTVLLLNLLEDESLTMVIEQVAPNATGGTNWIGKIEGDPLSLAVLVTQNGVLVGNIYTVDGWYNIRYAGGDVHIVARVDPAAIPEDAEPIAVEPREDEITSGADISATDDGSVIDVMVVYSPSARAYQGSTAAMLNTIDLQIAVTNQSYTNSNINQRIRLVHTAEIAYSGSGNLGTDLERLSGTSDGYMDNVHALRNNYGADLVALFVDHDGPYCGVGYVLLDTNTASPNIGFSAIDIACASGFTFAHELGHNMGGGHDWYVNSGTRPYPYAHGYVNITDRWRTIMAYGDECADAGIYCPAVPYWSNPNILYNGTPMGVPAGQANPADNHSVLNNTALTVANYRQANQPLGTELLTNRSMEVVVPSPWRGTNLSTADGSDCGIDYTGSCSLTVTSSPSGATKLLNYGLPGFTGSAGDQFNLRYYYRRVDAGGAGALQMRVTIRYTDDTVENFSYVPGIGTAGWQRFEHTFTATKDYDWGVVRVIYSKPNGTIWFDDISLRRNGSELLDNPSMEVTVPTPWRGFNLSTADGSDCGMDYTGSCSLTVTGSPSGATRLLNYGLPGFTGSAGDQFYLGYYYRRPEAGGAGALQVRVTIRYTDNSVENFNYVPGVSTAGWQRLQHTFTAAKDYDWGVIRIIYSKPEGTLWFDDISLLIDAE